jgi:hypothetical protein
MRTVGTLEAEWKHVLRGNVSTWAKEDESSTGLLDFTMLGPLSLGARFETYELFISLIFHFFFGPR